MASASTVDKKAIISFQGKSMILLNYRDFDCTAFMGLNGYISADSCEGSFCSMEILRAHTMIIRVRPTSRTTKNTAV